LDFSGMHGVDAALFEIVSDCSLAWREVDGDGPVSGRRR
jgi:hypothetical protein